MEEDLGAGGSAEVTGAGRAGGGGGGPGLAPPYRRMEEKLQREGEV